MTTDKPIHLTGPQAQVLYAVRDGNVQIRDGRLFRTDTDEQVDRRTARVLTKHGLITTGDALPPSLTSTGSTALAHFESLRARSSSLGPDTVAAPAPTYPSSVRATPSPFVEVTPQGRRYRGVLLRQSVDNRSGRGRATFPSTVVTPQHHLAPVPDRAEAGRRLTTSFADHPVDAKPVTIDTEAGTTTVHPGDRVFHVIENGEVMRQLVVGRGLADAVGRALGEGASITQQDIDRGIVPARAMDVSPSESQRAPGNAPSAFEHGL